jgi:tRNA G37 N-methylase Trm5
MLEGDDITKQREYPKKAKPLSIKDKLILNLKAFCEENSLELSKELLDDFPKKWRIFDDLAVIPSTCFQLNKWSTIDCKQLWQLVASSLKVKRLAQENRIKLDDYRSPNVKMLLGDDTWVFTINNGIKYTFDLTKSMYSAGNITEKLRIAKFNCEKETVIDLFAGVGYFALPYIIHAKAKKLIACEWNPASIEALKRNLILNKCEKKCEILEGDNRQTCPINTADRINLGLIPSSETSWLIACKALRQDTGGRLHIHGNVDIINKQSHQEWSRNTQNKIKELLNSISNEQTWNVEIEHIEYVKSYAPRVDHLVVDLLCRPQIIF